MKNALAKVFHPRAAWMLAAAALGGGASSARADSAAAPDGYSLVFSDEFDGGELDRGKWCTRLAYGNGAKLQVDDAECRGPGGHQGTGDFLKDEQQRYRDYNSWGEPLHELKDGYLKLRATKSGNDSYAKFESSLIRSKYEFKPSSSTSYFVSTRVRLPSTLGSFAAVWLATGFGTDGKLAWPPELDILEAAMNGKDDRDNMVRVGAHVQGAQTDSGAEEFSKTGSKFDTKWNNYIADKSLRDVWVDVTAEWKKEELCVSFGGDFAVCERYRWVDPDGSSANGASLILNLAVGGAWAGRYGVDGSSPMAMDVDYVRVYKSGGGSSASAAASQPSAAPAPAPTASAAPAPAAQAPAAQAPAAQAPAAQAPAAQAPKPAAQAPAATPVVVAAASSSAPRKRAWRFARGYSF